VGKPLKRLAPRSTSVHRAEAEAEAAVLMRTCWNAREEKELANELYDELVGV